MLQRFTYSFFACMFSFCLSLAQPSGTCDCFSTEVLHAADTLSDCRYYEFQISHDGNCRHGLSNFTMAIECGSVSDVWNSLNSAMELNFQDPNNGLWGFKVDNIQGFGEGNEPDTFQVGFVFCPDDDYCADWQTYWEPVVAYKAGQCIIYDTLDLSMLPGLKPSVGIRPNPTRGPVTLDVTMPGPGDARLEIIDLFGNRLMLPMHASFSRQQRVHREADLSQLSPGLYLYLLHTDYGTDAGRVWIQP